MNTKKEYQESLIKNKLIALLLFTPLSILLSIIFLYETYISYQTYDNNLVSGTVVSREKTKAYTATRTLIKIKIDNTGTVVNAVLMLDKETPDKVSFYYSGNPAKEVYLQCETNPLLGTLIFTIFSIPGILAYRFYFRQKNGY